MGRDNSDDQNNNDKLIVWRGFSFGQCLRQRERDPMKKVLLVMLIICLNFVGCASYKATKFYSMPSEQDKLPPLMVAFKSDMAIPEHPVHRDVLELIDNELRANIIEDNDSEYHGFALIEVRDGALCNLCTPASSMYVMFSTISMSVLNLFGFPFTEATSHVIIEITVYDSEMNEVEKFLGRSKGSALTAYYYGYSLGSAKKMAVLDATRKAMDKIVTKVRRARAEVSGLLKDKPEVDANSIKAFKSLWEDQIIWYGGTTEFEG